jgi:hypothetical protein
MREHKSIESKLNKRTEAPVNFAFTEDYDHISVAKCRFCKAWLFWPETTQKEWCCGQGKYIELINPWSQPTDAFRSLCIDDTKVLIDGTAQHLPGRGTINGAFMHGHCNVALSRVRNRESLAILVDETNLVTDPTTGKRAARTTNIVCRTILDM